MSDMAMRAQRGVDVVFEAPVWSPRWVLRDGVTTPVTPEHQQATNLLCDILRQYITRTGVDASAGENIALRWDEAHPKVGVDPDVYLVQPALPKYAEGILTWTEGHAPPRVVAEVVSPDTARKDYLEGPLKYAASGARELWIFDPERCGPRQHGGPWLLQVWRRTGAKRFRREYAGDGPAYSKELSAWLVVTDDGQRLRIADDEAGELRWPTPVEAIRAEREAAEAESHVVEADVVRLRAEIAALLKTSSG